MHETWLANAVKIALLLQVAHENMETFSQVDRAMEDEGWKLLLLCRLSPLIPYNVLNITMASTKIHFWPFAIVSFLGDAPYLASQAHTNCHCILQRV